MNIPQTGPNAAKANFFHECSQAFEFLYTFYTLKKEQQLELLQIINRMHTENLK